MRLLIYVITWISTVLVVQCQQEDTSNALTDEDIEDTGASQDEDTDNRTEDGLVILTHGANSTLGYSCLRRYRNSRQRNGYIYANRTEASCRDMCFGSLQCAGVTHNDVTGACFFHEETGRNSHMENALCCVHYKKIVCPLDEDGRLLNVSIETGNEPSNVTSQRPAPAHSLKAASVCMLPFKNARQEGGEIHENHTLATCTTLCEGLFSCAAAHFENATGQCTLHEKTSAVSHTPDNCCNHVKKVPCLRGSEGDPEETLEPECRNNSIFQRYPSANQMAGERLTQIRDATGCKEYCRTDTSCMAVDFHRLERSCWYHSHANDTSHQDSPCCDHYKKVSICQYDCFKVQKNARALTLDGTIFPDADVSVCRRRCLADDGCRSFAFSASQSFCLLMSYTLPPQRRSYDEDFELWIKKTCGDRTNDTIEFVTTSTTTTSSTALPTEKAPESPPTIVIRDFTRPPDLPATTIKPGGFLKTTSAIIVFAGCGFIFLVGMATVFMFCIHRYREKQKQKNKALNPANPHNWIRNQGGRASFTSSSLWIPISQADVYNSYRQPDPMEAWRNDMHYVRKSHPTYSHSPNPKLHHVRRNSCQSEPSYHKSYHGNVDKMATYDAYKKWPRLIPDYNTYPCPSLKLDPAPMYECSEVSSHTRNSPHHLQRIDSSSVLGDEVMYQEEFGRSDHFYTGTTAL